MTPRPIFRFLGLPVHSTTLDLGRKAKGTDAFPNAVLSCGSSPEAFKLYFNVQIVSLVVNKLFSLSLSLSLSSLSGRIFDIS